ncbi:MAG TPA: transporter substrate-binding domain-containing protein [Methylomirabilota bacterium]|jgi:polar amino acid transport system substrate-binding protein|nr:transporter substrate-binding domain-containing protein [Methylomirabilota bacterium]
MSHRRGPLARLVTLLALLGFLLTPLVAFSQDTLAEIKKRGSINVYVEAQYRPYEFRDQSGEIVGLDIDLARKMFEEGLGLKVVFTDLDLTGVLGSLLTRKADFVISGITMTQERAKRFDLSIPYSEAGAAVLVRIDETRMKGPEDLSGKLIGTQLGSSSQKAAEAFEAQLKGQGKPGYAELKTYERFPTAQQDLLAKRLDAVVQGRPPLKVLIKERPGQFKILSGLGPKAYYGAVVRKGDTALLEYVNGQLRKFKQDGTLKALQEKWLGESDVHTLPDPWTPLS